MAPFQSAAAPAAAAAKTAGTATAVVGVLVELATGLHGVLLAMLVTLMALDGILGALRADRAGAWVESQDRRGLRKRFATVIIVLIAFVVDGMFVAVSHAVGIWPGVFEVGWFTVAAIFWAGRLEAWSVYRNALSIFGARDVFRPLQVAAEGMGAVEELAADRLAGALGERRSSPGDISLPGDGA